jgi:hypothetical protein
LLVWIAYDEIAGSGGVGTPHLHREPESSR